MNHPIARATRRGAIGSTGLPMQNHRYTTRSCRATAARRLAVLALAGFTAAIPAPVSGAKAPAWVESVPLDAGFYHGIGMATKKGETSAFRDLARHRALRNLSMQISTTVSSRFVLNTIETTGMTEEEVKSEILTHTESCLEGYELVDSYETRTEYWEFYRFSKDDCRVAQERARARATAAAAAFIGEALQAEQRREMVGALRLYCQAISALRSYFGEKPSEFVKSQSALERILSSLRLTASRAEMPAVAGETVREPITITGIFLAGGTPEPARHLPFQFVIGEAGNSPVMHGVADGNGCVTLPIGTATADQNGALAHARVDLSGLLDTEESNPLFLGFLSRLSIPEATIALRVFPADDRDAFLWHWGFAGKRVAVYAGYSAGGKNAPWNKMRDEMAKTLANAGAVIVPGTATIEQALAWAADPRAPWPHDAATTLDTVLIAAATGRINRRDAPANPFGQDCQFAGEICTLATTGATAGFSDRYQGAGGWNPMGEEMALDVLAIHAGKRWQTALLKYLGSK